MKLRRELENWNEETMTTFDDKYTAWLDEFWAANGVATFWLLVRHSLAKEFDVDLFKAGEIVETWKENYSHRHETRNED